MPAPTALPRCFWQQGVIPVGCFGPVALVVGAIRAREGVRLRGRFPGLSSLCRWLPGIRHGRGARRRKSGDGRGGGVGLGLRVQASVSRSQVSARGQGSAVHDRHGVFRGPSFFCFSKRSASGSGYGWVLQQIHPSESPRRDPWISAKFRPG